MHLNLLQFFAITSAVTTAALLLIACIRQRRAASDWFFAVGLAAILLERLCAVQALRVTNLPALIQWHEWRLAGTATFTAIFLGFAVSYARGNPMRYLRGWGAATAIAFVVPLALVFARRGALLHAISGAEGSFVLEISAPAIAIHFVVLATAVFILMNLERTFRASTGTMRWRIKFMLLGVAVLFVARFYTSTQILLFHGFTPALDAIDSMGTILSGLVMARALFRSSSFQTEVYPSHSFLQGSITAILIGGYLVFVGVFAEVVARLGGDASFALKTFVVLLAIIALAVLLQSDRARLRLRRFVSQHLQRPMYDYRSVWKRFTDATASHVAETDLSRSVVKLTGDLFQALSVSVWLASDSKQTLVLAASTVISNSQSGAQLPTVTESAAILSHFADHPAAADIERVEADWGRTLQRCQPRQFPNGGNRICVPLQAANNTAGVMIVGDRVDGVPFSDQDLELLKCIADQFAASLLNTQLSRQLVQAKELEAFQTMATFFVHDLKNAASTLNLILQNLPVHFADPGFRADALRGMERTVAHINDLVQKLSSFREGLALRPAPTDLNALVQQSIAQLQPTAIQIIQQLQPIAPVLADQDQIRKVLTNLLLNATEAMANGKGQITVATAERQPWGVLRVTDTGCGMSPEFIEKSLFRPFQTTKKAGLGIGMFQSKMIVEAHRGRITVLSTPGQGTTFEIHLPLRGKHS